MRCDHYNNNLHQQLIVVYLYHRLIVRFGEVLLLKKDFSKSAPIQQRIPLVL
uniref:Uncharacterized protein n=1 Tax=Octopus bimaculoides TaxID=37653 RepID=A0A0L8I3E7_OCTBM